MKTIVINRIHLFWIALVLLTPILGACQKEESHCGEKTEIQARTPFDGADACVILNIDISGLEDERPFVISRPEEINMFRPCVEEAENVEIDFEKEFLVGVKIWSACGIRKQQEVTLQCDKLVYSVEIQNSICAAITSAYYYVLIPREYLDYPIEMEVTKIN